MARCPECNRFVSVDCSVELQRDPEGEVLAEQEGLTFEYVVLATCHVCDHELGSTTGSHIFYPSHSCPEEYTTAYEEEYCYELYDVMGTGCEAVGWNSEEFDLEVYASVRCRACGDEEVYREELHVSLEDLEAA